MKLIAIVFTTLASLFCRAQVNIQENVFIHSNAAVAFFDAPVYFNRGILYTPQPQPGVLLFSSADPFGANNNSHADTPVMSHNHSDFVFPVGDDGVYQPLSIAAGDGANLIVRFQHLAHDDLTLPAGVDLISDQFYWQVQGQKRAHVGLHWNSFSMLSRLTDNLADLTILGHTATGWEVIPAQLAPFGEDGVTPTSLEVGQIVSQGPVAFGRYDALTIGGIKKVTALLVSEAITPNGDNINDTWYIENVDRYPELSIRVYNRWGGEVFAHQGRYNNDWNGTYKNNTQTLPEAPYYYRIDLDNDGTVDQEGWIYINY